MPPTSGVSMKFMKAIACSRFSAAFNMPKLSSQVMMPSFGARKT